MAARLWRIAPRRNIIVAPLRFHLLEGGAPKKPAGPLGDKVHFMLRQRKTPVCRRVYAKNLSVREKFPDGFLPSTHGPKKIARPRKTKLATLT